MAHSNTTQSPWVTRNQNYAQYPQARGSEYEGAFEMQQAERCTAEVGVWYPDENQWMPEPCGEKLPCEEHPIGLTESELRALDGNR